MRPSNPVPVALSRTRSSLELVLAGLRWLLATLAAGTRRVGSRTVAVVRGPVAAILIGRRVAVSVVLVGLAPVLAALTAWVVAATTGYHPLERWLVGTWSGTDPHAAVFVGVALLVGLAAASAAADAGVFSAVLLTAGPLFGAAVTRYGTVVTTYAGERVVSLPDALAFAFGVAAVGGVALGAVGYALGILVRRGARTVRAAATVPIGRRRNGD